MAFTFYGNVSEASTLSGVVEADITIFMQQSINNWIDLNIREYGFGKNDVSDEYHSIFNTEQKELILEKFPVISKDSLSIVDNVNSNTPINVDEDCYHIDLQSGIVQIIPVQNSTVQTINYFTKGIHSVKVDYSYGYESVPDDISKIATLLIAKWTKIKNTNADADGLKSLKAGDYSETKDLDFMLIKSEFDEELLPMIKQAKIKYAIV